MNEENKNIDELFSRSLSEPHVPFMEADWTAMKRKLEKDKKRRGIAWWSAVSGMAAALLITLAWWGTSIVSDSTGANSMKTAVPKHSTAEEHGLEEAQNGIADQKEAPVSGIIHRSAAPGMVYDEQRKRKNISQMPERTEERLSQEIADAPQNDQKAPAAMLQDAPEPIVHAQNPVDISTAQSTAVPTSVKADVKPDALIKADSSRAYAKADTKFRPSFILSITATPDVSAVNSFKRNKLDFGGGLLATIILSPRLSISSGAVLARKLYGTEFSNYKPGSGYKFITNPLNVNADCRVLDIPLNISYTVWQKQKNSFQFSAGASSYIMLTENYEYEYASKYTKGPYSYEVRNINRHYFGVGNLAIAYQRKLNDNTAISIQPYLKLPLTDIGYGNVKLLSTGVAVSLDMNLSNITGKK